MNRERAKELLPIIEAYAEGKNVECRAIGDDAIDDWVNLDDDEDGLLCLDECEYRIKPMPREWWVNTGSYDCYANEDRAVANAISGDKIVHVREVIE